MKNRYLVYFVLAGLFLGIFFGNVTHNVNATIPTYTENFDLYYDRNQVNNGWLHTQGGYGQGYGVTVSNYHSAYNSYRTGEANVTNFNFTSANNNFAGCNFWIKPYTSSTSYGNNYKSINFMNGSTIAFTVYLWRIENDDHICIESTGGVRTQLFDNSVYFHVVLTVISSNIVNVSVYNLTNVYKGGFTDGTPQPISSVNRMQINKYPSNTIATNIDDFSLMLGAIGPSTICGYDMTPYTTIGTLTNDYSVGVSSKHIFENYVAPITTQIKGIELSVDNAQFTIDSDLSHYLLRVNDGAIYASSCFYLAPYDSSSYIIFWKVDIGLNNETLSLNFTHTTLLDANNYWYVENGGYGRDLDYDGDATSGQGSVVRTECSWIWIYPIPIPFYVCIDYYGLNQVNYDLSYRFYHTGIRTLDVYNYSDSLGLFGYSYKNSTGYVYDLADNGNIICTYNINDISYDYTIELYRNGIEVLNSDFPFKCKYPGGSVGYTTSLTGKYVFKLKKVNYVDNITAYVIGNLPSIYVRTQPVITDLNDPYTVLYKYTHPQYYSGGCAMFNDFTLINKYDKKIYGVDISNDSESNFTYYSDGISTEFWRLFSYKDGAYYPYSAIAKHYIRLPNIIDNNINCNVYTITVEQGNEIGRDVIITGSHIYPGAEISIYVGGQFKGYVGDTQLFEYRYIPMLPGVFNVDLCMKQNGTLVILARAPQQLTVIVKGYNNTVTKNELDIFSFIQKLAIGFGIALGFLCIPLVLSVKFHMEIHIFVYLFFGIIGLVVATVTGFLSPIIIGCVMLILVMIIIIMWLQRKMV